MKRFFNLLTAILICVTAILVFVYFKHGGITLKALTSLSFALCGLINLIFAIFARIRKLTPAVLVFLGLLLSFIGDVAISRIFVVGALIFALGHIFYLLAFCSFSKPSAFDIIPFCLLFSVSAGVILFTPLFKLQGIMLFVCIAYSFIISAMCGKAVSNAIRFKNFQSTVWLIAAVLFFISDAALLFYMFGSAGEAANHICMFTYFPAQCLFAFGMNRYINSEIHQ